MGSCSTCKDLRCSWCSAIKNTDSFQSEKTKRSFKIFHKVNCKAAKVIYLLTCKGCRKQNVGKAWRQFNTRFNLHRSQIKKREIWCCELVRHVVQKGLNFATNFEITIIEQLKQNINLTEEKQKEVLKTQEICWQTKLQTLQPSGLNKRQG